MTSFAAPVLSACGSSRSGGPVSSSVALVRSDVARAAGDAGAAAAAASSITALAGTLYGELAKQPGNLVYSPYSISVALAMTVNGARGKTADEMRSVLHVRDLETFNGGLNALTQRLEGLAGKHLALDTANSLWGQAGVRWEGAFLDTLARDYGTGLRTVDYERATEEARRLINRWTADQTHDKITEIIPPGVLDEMTRLVLVNAIYLKAPWLTPFEEHATEDLPFHPTDGDTVSVPMMGGAEEAFARKRGDGWNAVRLPYDGGGLAMTVVVPEDLGALEALIGQEGLDALLDWQPDDGVTLRLPKWRFRLQSPLDEILEHLGMPTAFTTAADFTAMTHDAELMISAVLHEAFIAVDENGTEAAAATAVVMRDTSARIGGDELVVDRPFLFVIHDVQDNTPLFVGRVLNPLD
jgi:serpin B